MTTEQAVVGGRETFGEPKKLADVTPRSATATRCTAGSRGWVSRSSRSTAPRSPARAAHADRKRTDFYFKFLLDPSGKGFDTDPALVYCHREEKTRSLWSGRRRGHAARVEVRPGGRPARARVRFIEFAERSSKQYGEIVRTVPGDWIRPYVHQRYDDLSVVGTE